MRVTAARAAPDASLHKEYADSSDLEISLKIEVKQRHNVSFTCREDIPGGELIVCAVHSFTHNPPFAYIHLDDDASHAAIIYSGDSDKWEKRRIHDKRYGDNYSQMCYVTSAEHVHVAPFKDDHGRFNASETLDLSRLRIDEKDPPQEPGVP